MSKVGAKVAAFKYSEPRISVSLAPSRRAAACIVLACFATLAVVAATPVHVAVRALVLAWTGVASIASLRRVAWLRGRRGVRAFRVEGGAALEVEDGEGRVVPGEVRPGSFVAPWLTIVRWRPAGSRFTRGIVVLPDMLHAETFRALRVVLRWMPPPR